MNFAAAMPCRGADAVPTLSGCCALSSATNHWDGTPAREQIKPVLARAKINKIASSAAARSRRTAASHQWRDSTSDLGESTNTLAGASVLRRQLERGARL